MIIHYPESRRTDIDVDVLCVGSGIGLLAAAIGFRRNGLRVLVVHYDHPGLPAAAPRSGWGELLCHQWGVQLWHRPTVQYLEDLTDDIAGPFPHVAESHSPIKLLDAKPDGDDPAAVAPFVGAQLRPWALECLRSPAGTISTRVQLPGAVDAHMRSGERLHVHEVTEIPTEGPRGRSLWNHLLSQAVKSGATVRLATPLNRLVFDDGEVIGAVIGRTPHECVVRAWSHVVLGTGDPGASLLLPPLPSPSDTRLCLVRRHASRFGQLAVLSEYGAQVRLPRRQPARTRRLGHTSGAAVV